MSSCDMSAFQGQGGGPGGCSRDVKRDLFGLFFEQYEKCLLLMKTSRTVVAGAPLVAVVSDSSWTSRDLWFFTEVKDVTREVMLNWHEFLYSESYSISEEESSETVSCISWC